MIYHSIVLAASAPTLRLQQQETPLERLINALAIILLLLIIGICLVALIVVIRLLLPKASDLSRRALIRSPWRAFFIGLANYIFLGGISLVLLSTEIPPLSVIGLAIAGFLIGVSLIGLTGLTALIGERLAALQSGEMSPIKQLLWAAVALELAVLLPFVGWLLVGPIVLMIAFGAGSLAWRNRKQADFLDIS